MIRAAIRLRKAGDGMRKINADRTLQLRRSLFAPALLLVPHQAIAMYMPASAQHMMSQKPPKNVDLRCVLAQEPDHRLAYILVLCIGLQAVECSNGGGEQPPIPIRLLKPRTAASAPAPSPR